MLSKNNVQMINRKGQAQKQRFGLRKLSIGVASVLLGLTFLGASSASADETARQGQQEAQVELTTVQPATITNDESARQPNYFARRGKLSGPNSAGIRCTTDNKGSASNYR